MDSQAIKQAVVTAITDDLSPYPKGQCVHSGKPIKYTRLSPYGLDSNPPKDYHVLLISSQNQESIRLGIVSSMNNRKTGLKEGEFVLYNPLTGSFIFFKENGDIEVQSSRNVTITPQGSATIDSNDVKLGGTSGLKTLVNEDFLTLYDGHTHNETGSVTGAPNQLSSTEKTVNTTAK